MEFPIKVALARAVPTLPEGPGGGSSRSSTGTESYCAAPTTR
ncbi:hypothetical protein ABZV67_46375 [Streptomyces sp. NPDC005065]